MRNLRKYVYLNKQTLLMLLMLYGANSNQEVTINAGDRSAVCLKQFDALHRNLIANGLKLPDHICRYTSLVLIIAEKESVTLLAKYLALG